MELIRETPRKGHKGVSPKEGVNASKKPPLAARGSRLPLNRYLCQHAKNIGIIMVKRLSEIIRSDYHRICSVALDRDTNRNAGKFIYVCR